MFDYNKIAKTSQLSIQKYGMPIIFVKKEEGEYDPNTGTNPSIETQYNAFGVRDNAGIREVQAGGFSVGSVTMYIDGNSIPKPDTTDYIIFEGTKWGIENVESIEPAGTPLMYTIELKDLGKIDG